MSNVTVSIFGEQALSQPDIPVQVVNDDHNDHLRTVERAKELEKLFNEENLPNGFFYTREGLVFQPDAKENEDELPPGIFISSRLDVTACTRDDENENHGRLLEFKDIDGHLHRWAMPMELLAGDGSEYRSALLAAGLIIAPGSRPRQLLTIFIQTSKPSARVRCVSRTGWNKDCFVLPDQTIGKMQTERTILQTLTTNLPDYAIAGTLGGWKQNVSNLCQGNSLLTFAVSAAFAAPLLRLLNIESGGFNFKGTSSTGKTTALSIAASVWGGPDYMQRWRATTNGLEAVASLHNDTLLCLDEIAQVDPSAAGETAYMLANGMGKARADRRGSFRKQSKWNLLFLSTGEIGLEEHMREAGKRSRAGQEVRLVDIPADTYGFGVFENLHGHPNGAVFSQALKDACQKFYGAPSREFLKQLLVDQTAAIDKIRNFIDEFMTAYIDRGADGQVHRVAKRFAVIAAAGELATCFDLTGWQLGDASKAAKRCLEEWILSRGGTGSQEEKVILAQVRHFFGQHGDSRFTPWNAHQDHKTINRAGFRIDDQGEVGFYVFPETFKAEIAKGYDPTLVAKICAKHGILMTGSKGEFTRSERLPDTKKSRRIYRFTSRVLGDEDIGEESSRNHPS